MLFFVEITKLILNLTWKCKGVRLVKIIFKNINNNLEELHFLITVSGMLNMNEYDSESSQKLLFIEYLHVLGIVTR